MPTPTPPPTSAARAAAEWWAARVGAPTFRIVQPEERDLGTDFAELAAHTAAQKTTLTDEASTAFVDILERKVTEALARDAERIARDPDPDYRRREPAVGLHVDYGPEDELRDAAKEAGVPFERFPWKTNLWVNPQYVYASVGYHGRHTLIWSAPGWERPACGQHRYENSEPVDETCGQPRYHDGDCGEFQPDERRCPACAGPYSAHYSSAAYAGGSRCHSWARTARA